MEKAERRKKVERKQGGKYKRKKRREEEGQAKRCGGEKAKEDVYENGKRWEKGGKGESREMGKR